MPKMTETSTNSMSKSVGSMTVGELIDLLRNVEGRTTSADRENTTAPLSQSSAYEAVEAFNVKSADEREMRMAVIDMVGSSPPSLQVRFLKGLAENEDARMKFMEDPVGYSKDVGVLLDERVVGAAVDSLVLGRGIEQSIVDKIGIDAAVQLGGFRDPGTAAWPAAVAAIAAVVAAGAAVVNAVTSVMKSHSYNDLMRLKGLGPNGVRLPQGGAVLMGASSVGAALMVTSVAGAAVTGGGLGGALGSDRLGGRSY